MWWKSQRFFPATLALLFAATVTLAACSNTSPTTGGTPTGTSTAAQAVAILNHAKQAPLKDATFTFALGGTAVSTTVTTNGNGRLTTNPARTDLVFPSIQYLGFATTAEAIVDQASGTYYFNVPALSSQWLKADPAMYGVNIGVVMILDYDGLQNLTYIGSETINGIATQHIQGTKQLTQSGSLGSVSVTRTEDYWFRQSDYYPVKIVFQDVVNAAVGGSSTPTATASPTGTTPSPTPTNGIPSSISTASPTQTATPGQTATPSPTSISGQVSLTETFSFSAWDSGLTIALPTNVVGGS